MLSGLVLGFIDPRFSHFLMNYLETALIFMLLLIFLKIDLLEIIESMKNLRQMFFISFMTLLVVPILIYFALGLFAPTLAIGMLLLTAMPSGIGAPALADLLKGNVELSMSLTIFTSFLAPLSVPLLFFLLAGEQVLIDPLKLFEKLAILVFLPMIVSQILKRFVPTLIEQTIPYYSGINVLVFFFFVYATIGSQRHLLLEDPLSIIWQLLIMYLVYLFLHISGYWIGYRKAPEDRISIVLSNAYQNNGMAIVLAAAFFDPAILILMILSEFPWNTMPAMYAWFLKRKQRVKT